MGPPLYARNETTVALIARSQWFSSKEREIDCKRVFWDSKGILLIDYLEKGVTITGEYYSNLLDQLDAIIRFKKEKITIHQDGALVMGNLRNLGYDLLGNPFFF